jgi:hypothetical protein
MFYGTNGTFDDFLPTPLKEHHKHFYKVVTDFWVHFYAYLFGVCFLACRIRLFQSQKNYWIGLWIAIQFTSRIVDWIAIQKYCTCDNTVPPTSPLGRASARSASSGSQSSPSSVSARVPFGCSPGGPCRSGPRSRCGRSRPRSTRGSPSDVAAIIMQQQQQFMQDR